MSLEDSFDPQITEFRVRSHRKAGVILRLDFTDGAALGRAQGCYSYEEREPGSLPFTELPTGLISKYRPINHAFLKSRRNKPGQETEPDICIAFNSQKPAIPLTRKKPYTTTGEKDMPIFGPGPRRQGPCPPWLCFPCPRQRTFPGPPLPDTGSEIRG